MFHYEHGGEKRLIVMVEDRRHAHLPINENFQILTAYLEAQIFVRQNVSE